MPKVTKQNPTNRTRTSKLPSIANRIRGIGFDDAEGIKLNIYGRSGSGKTTMWSTAPAPILALICSGGNKPGELRSIDTLENRKRIKQLVINNSLEIREAIDYQMNGAGFNTIVLDHATGLQHQVLKEVADIDELPAQLGWGIVSQQAWGQVSLQMKELLRALLNLDCNVIIVAQEREFQPEEGSEVIMPYVASALSPSVTGWLNPAVDYICQTFIRQRTRETTVGKTKLKKIAPGVDYCLRVGPHSVFTTKFRLPKGIELPEVIVDPTFDKVYNLIKAGRKP